MPVDFWGERGRGVLGDEFKRDGEIWREGVVDEARYVSRRVWFVFWVRAWARRRVALFVKYVSDV